MATVSETLSTWLAGLDAPDIPDNAAEGVTHTLIDTVGLAYAARKTDYMRALATGWEVGQGKATAFGLGKGGMDAASAAMFNGTAAHGEDFDNTYEGCPVHSGAVIVPAVLAVAESRGLTGARAFAGMAAGIEVMCRMGQVAGKGVHSAGFHPTAVIGAMGAAAGAGVALGLDPPALVRAFGLAGSCAAGIIEYLADGSWTKRMHAGWAAQAGIRAATMAQAGFIGPISVYEGEHGFYTAFAHSIDPDFTPLTGDLGSRWEAARLSFKPYACGTMCQPYVDCAVRLAEQGITADEVEQLTCKVGEGTVHRLWEPLALKHSPPSAYGAKFSGPYCVAVGLIDGDAGLAQFTDERVNDPAVLGLAGRVAYEIDPRNEYPVNYTGDIQALLKDGRTAEEHQPCLRGGSRDPLTDADIERKFRANLRYGGMKEDAVDNLLRFCRTIRDCKDLGALAAYRT
ncbi:MAG TPA: MmgE/PrpD family protein [Alphaproteobacteria bacterium]|nr:MmgE/PrpD family protein [Alphaproteobacteria bacterium]